MAAEGWEENPDLKKLYVAKLKPEITNQGLHDHFGNYGTVTECKVVTDNEGNSRGFAFVSMSDQEVVDAILEERPHTIDGHTVFLRRAIPKDDPNPLAQTKTKKLFIGGLTEEATEQDITDVLAIFTRHPPEEIKLMRDRNTNKFKGYAFVLFHSEDIVDKLFIIRNATIKDKRVELKKAEETGAPGGRGGGAGGRGGGRGGGGFRGGRGGARGGGGGGGGGGYSQSSYGGGGGYEGYGSTYSTGYDYSGYADYNNGYSYAPSGGYSSGYGGGYGSDYSIGQYSSEPSGYGPTNRRGGGRGRGGGAGGGGGGYRPY